MCVDGLSAVVNMHLLGLLATSVQPHSMYTFIRYDVERLPVGDWGYYGECNIRRPPALQKLRSIKDERLTLNKGDTMFFQTDAFQYLHTSLLTASEEVVGRC